MDTAFVVVRDSHSLLSLAVVPPCGWTMTIVNVLRTVGSCVAHLLLGICAVFAAHHGDLTVRKFFSYVAVAGAAAVYQARSTYTNVAYLGLVFLVLAVLFSLHVPPFSSSWREPS